MSFSKILSSLMLAAAVTCTYAAENDTVKPATETKPSIPQQIDQIKNEAVQPIFKAKAEDQEAMIKENFTIALAKVDALMTDNLSAEDRSAIYSYQLDTMTALAHRGVTEMDPRLDELFKTLYASGDESLVKMAQEKELTREISRMKTLPKEEQAELARKYCNYIIQREPGTETLGLAWTLSRILQGSAANAAVADAHDELANHFEQLKGDSFQRAATDFRGTARRIRLPGSEMELTGTTMDGEHFDIKQLHGKVVLVDFWDMYCKPCRAEFPRVKKLYEQYKPDGFEVVGVNLDTEVETLKKVLAHEDLPWTTLNEPTDSKKRGWINPVAKHYGINAVPCMILIGADGKVISITARGEELERLLADIFTKQS
ncbi:TlpA family protein disulfide reductase [Lacunimicrobium album]